MGWQIIKCRQRSAFNNIIDYINRLIHNYFYFPLIHNEILFVVQSREFTFEKCLIDVVCRTDSSICSLVLGKCWASKQKTIERSEHNKKKENKQIGPSSLKLASSKKWSTNDAFFPLMCAIRFDSFKLFRHVLQTTLEVALSEIQCWREIQLQSEFNLDFAGNNEKQTMQRGQNKVYALKWTAILRSCFFILPCFFIRLFFLYTQLESQQISFLPLFADRLWFLTLRLVPTYPYTFRHFAE